MTIYLALLQQRLLESYCKVTSTDECSGPTSGESEGVSHALGYSETSARAEKPTWDWKIVGRGLKREGWVEHKCGERRAD